MTTPVDSQGGAKTDVGRRPASLLRRRPMWVVTLIAAGAIVLGAGVGFVSQQSTINGKSGQISTLKHQNSRLTSRINGLAAKLQVETAATNLLRAQQERQAAFFAAVAQQQAAAAAQRQQQAAAGTSGTATCTLSPSVCQQLQYQIDNPGAPLANTDG